MACVGGRAATARQPKGPLNVGYCSICRDEKYATDFSVFLYD